VRARVECNDISHLSSERPDGAQPLGSRRAQEILGQLSRTHGGRVNPGIGEKTGVCLAGRISAAIRSHPEEASDEATAGVPPANEATRPQREQIRMSISLAKSRRKKPPIWRGK